MMSQQLDPIQIARLQYTSRASVINQLLQQLLALDPATAENALKSILTALASKATDEEYKNWCEVTIRLLSMYDDSVVRNVLALRMKVASTLPKNLAERDQKIVMEVLNSLDESVKEKILKNLK
jgi:uncharacterized protein YecA (UPF0149 family)